MPNPKELLVLGLETSCDETAASVVRWRADETPDILSNVVFDQNDAHAIYGGVVPELAARAHIERVDHVIAKAMREAGLGFSSLNAIAATAGPGLIGGVMVGLTTAKGVALMHDLPLVGVNHLEGHALSARLSAPVPFPFLLLLISGGHTQLLAVRDVGDYRRLGTTIDDAAGEAFDKTAKLMGLGFPGGPALEARARRGDAARFALPSPLKGRKGCDFSFSGLKTAVRQTLEGLPEPEAQDLDDLSAALQAAVAAHLAGRSRRAMDMFRAETICPYQPYFVAAGGVAANETVRAALREAARDEGFAFEAPPLRLCTDNGAMIAYAGAEIFARGRSDPLTLAPRARWPLDPTPSGFGSGRKGPKA